MKENADQTISIRHGRHNFVHNHLHRARIEMKVKIDRMFMVEIQSICWTNSIEIFAVIAQYD